MNPSPRDPDQKLVRQFAGRPTFMLQMTARLKFPLLLAVLAAAGALLLPALRSDGATTAAPLPKASPLEEPFDAVLGRQLSGDPDVDLGAAFQRASREARAIASQTADKAPGVAAAKWELIGPHNIGGRLLDIALDPDKPDTAYVASAGGGVWKTENAGRTMQPAWPDDLPQAIGAIAMTRDGVLYAGTGETGPGGGSMTYGGNGVYRSADRGRTWQNIGLRESSRIAEIVVDPADPKKIWVAASGPLYKPGGERGLYLSTDGGDTWTLKLAGDNDTTGATDIAINPQDPKVMYVAMWDHQRTPDQRLYNGVGSGLYKSTDGGESFSRIGAGTVFLLPNPQIGRLGIALAPSEPDTLYVQSSGPAGAFTGFYKSTDAGATFTPAADTDQALGGPFVYGWWFGRVWVDPKDPDHVFVAGVNLLESDDGGTSFRVGGAGVHADQHAMAWDPRVGGRVYLGNDGGFYRSDDNAGEWVKSEYEPYSQFYSIDVSEQDASRIVGGLQDNGVNRSYPDEWNSYVGGDGLAARIAPDNQDVVFGCYQYGECSKSTDGGDSARSFTNEVVGTRKNWFTPLEFDPCDPQVMYTGSEILSRSTDQGETWVPASPDLTNGPGKETNPLFRNYGTITTVSSPCAETGKIYVGTDDGNLWYTDDGGTIWTKAADPDLPDAWVTRVEADTRDKNIAYVTYSGFRSGDEKTYVFRTGDGGASWDNISGNLPSAPVNDINIVGDDLVVATDVGVFVTRDLGRTWLKIGSGLPVTTIYELRFNKATNHLYAATFGRSLYKVDYASLDRAPAAPPKTARPRKVRLLGAGCVRAGKLRVKVKAPKGARLKTVTLTAGKRKVVLKGRRIKRPVTIRTRGAVKVRLRATARSGKRFSDSRTYRRCSPKKGV
jgi:photosystem II stability/assembly factor-like uncharacterized protein